MSFWHHLPASSLNSLTVSAFVLDLIWISYFFFGSCLLNQPALDAVVSACAFRRTFRVLPWILMLLSERLLGIPSVRFSSTRLLHSIVAKFDWSWLIMDDSLPPLFSPFSFVIFLHPFSTASILFVLTLIFGLVLGFSSSSSPSSSSPSSSSSSSSPLFLFLQVGSISVLLFPFSHSFVFSS